MPILKYENQNSIPFTEVSYDFENFFNKTAYAFSIAVDAKSPWTYGHSKRVAYYSLLTSKQLNIEDHNGELPIAGLLHDIGKIGIPDYILNKPDSLTNEEWLQVKKHPIIGSNLIESIGKTDTLASVIRQHHERIDGKGYPYGLKGDEISMNAKVLSVADSFDAMTSNRPYRQKMSNEKALDILKKNAGTQWDSKIVDAFIEAISKDKNYPEDNEKQFSCIPITSSL